MLVVSLRPRRRRRGTVEGLKLYRVCTDQVAQHTLFVLFVLRSVVFVTSAEKGDGRQDVLGFIAQTNPIYRKPPEEE